MTTLTVHTEASAPAAAKPILAGAKAALGFTPNLYGVLAESPAVLEAYGALGKFFEKTSLNALERQVVYLTINAENACHYCMAAHSTLADMQKLDRSVTDALRAGRPLADPKLQALSAFTAKVVRERGWVSDADVASLISAGYTKATVLDVVLGVAHKTISNYLNHIAETPVDDAFKANAWTKNDAVTA